MVAPPLCWGCGADASARGPLCGPCRADLRWLAPELVVVEGVELWAPLAYEGAARALVGALKFRGAGGVAEAMAAQIVATAPPGLLARAALVPVPLHPARLRRRGFNQAERLADAIAARTALPVVRCLRRVGSPATQVGRDRAERVAALQDAIAVASAVPARSLLVDDVVTTGATLAACAEALARAGAREVAAVAYARTLGR